VSSPFDTPDAPGSGDRFVNAEHEGELLVIKVKGHEADVETSSGTADVIIADVTVVDGPHKGEHYADAWLFGKVLVPQLKRKIGRTILGRYGKGQAQKGKTAPWQLDPASEDDTALAIRVMNELQQAEPAKVAGGDSAAPAATDLGDTPPWERR
jgi:hypothetical protein